MQMILKPVFLNHLLHWCQKEIQLYSLGENYPPSDLIYYLNEPFTNEVMVSVTSFTCSSR